VRCGTIFSELNEDVQGTFVDPGERMAGWCANDLLHICDETRAESLLASTLDLGVIAELCPGGITCP
jgi:hypothetical protein